MKSAVGVSALLSLLRLMLVLIWRSYMRWLSSLTGALLSPLSAMLTEKHIS